MNLALSQAKKCLEEEEVPVGAVICRNREVISVGRNRREKGKNALYHAEIEAIDSACKALGGWRLWECEMFVTLEPCPMCAGAIINSRLKKITYGAKDSKNGAAGTVIDLFSLPFNYRPEVNGGFMEEECSAILSEFFSELRNKKARSNKNE